MYPIIIVIVDREQLTLSHQLTIMQYSLMILVNYRKRLSYYNNTFYF